MTTEGSLKGKRIGEMLVEQGFLTREQLNKLLETQRQQGGKLHEILLAEKLVTPDDLAAMYSIQLNLPLIDLKRHNVQPRALALVPESTARQHNLIPLDLVGDSLVVVMADPTDITTIEDLKTQTGRNVDVALGVPADIEQAINLNYRAGAAIAEKVSEISPVESRAEEKAELTATTPVAQSLELIVNQAVRDRASDIHVVPEHDRLRIRGRVDGVLSDIALLPLSVHAPLVSRIKILSGMNIAEQRRPQDGQFSIKVGLREVDVRVATMDTVYGERVTLRLLDKSIALFSLASLGFRAGDLRKFESVLQSPFGMILAAGPTGSGKTTTLYAALQKIERQRHNIMTIEDPVEYRFDDISQTQVNEKAGITFASGVRALMRHDPDVILVGEIRDPDTAGTAVKAALTGHLLLSTVHANDAISASYRLFDLGLETYLITSTLICVVAQRMVRRVCRYCRTTYQPNPEEAALWEKEMGEPAPLLYHGRGCQFCGKSGYLGRMGIYEIMVINDELRHLIARKAGVVELKEAALRAGMTPIRHDGLLKVKEGLTTLEEVRRSVFTIG
jgi:type IV pilus assembly protein PilB